MRVSLGVHQGRPALGAVSAGLESIGSISRTRLARSMIPSFYQRLMRMTECSHLRRGSSVTVSLTASPDLAELARRILVADEATHQMHG